MCYGQIWGKKLWIYRCPLVDGDMEDIFPELGDLPKSPVGQWCKMEIYSEA